MQNSATTKSPLQTVRAIGGWRALRRLVLVIGLAAVPAVHAEQATQPVRLLVDDYSDQYDDLFRYYASRHFGPFVDWRWFKAQAVAESMLNAQARSEANARGLMQLLPSTFQEVRGDRADWDDIHSPHWNVAAGLYYNRMLYRKWSETFHGQDRFLLMLASYNAGFYRVLSTYRNREKVRSWEDIKSGLPRETQAYVERIRTLMSPKPQPGVPAMVAHASM